MPEFTYRVVNQEGVISSGLMDAPSEAGLEERLASFGYTLIEAAEKKQAALSFGTQKVSRTEILNLTLYLHTTLAAGIPLLSALEGFVEQQADGGFKTLIKGIMINISGGDLFSDALRRHDSVFPELYISLIEAGEASGQLEETLFELISYLEGQEKIAADIKQATVYPLVILSLVALLLIFILSYVLPRFMPLFKSTGIELPASARFLMGVSGFFQTGWPYMLGFVLLLFIAIPFLKKMNTLVLMMDRLKLKIPLFGVLIMKISMSQFCYNLSTLLNAGIEINQAFSLSRRVIRNQFITQAIQTAQRQIEGGSSITRAMSGSRLFPPLVIQMFKVGEDSGSLPDTLKKVRQYYDREVAASIKRTFSILEPALILFLGLVVGGIAVTIFSTLYKVILSVGKA